MSSRDFLKTVDIFASLSDKELKNLARFIESRQIHKDEVLFHEGDEGDELYIVNHGVLGISVELSDGGSLEVAEFGPGDFFGEMSIFQREPRSATCTVKKTGVLLTLKAELFFKLGGNHPETSVKIIEKMLEITVHRLRNTNGLLTDMVQWGEKASRRAAIDELTGLYNRDFFDTTLKQRIRESRKKRDCISLAMLDLDGFGKLNARYSESVCNGILTKAAEVFTEVFDNSDIITRYGGDEFAFILPGRTAVEAQKFCNLVCTKLREIKIEAETGGIIPVSASMGIASAGKRKISSHELIRRADASLYKAKEAGKDRTVCYGSREEKSMKKKDITGIAAKNRIVLNIVTALKTGENFLILGHHNPDEDCIASMVAISLLIKKMNKNVYILLTEEIHERFQYLLNICRYNAITVLSDCSGIAEEVDTICAVDTPKPSMLQTCPTTQSLMQDPEIRILEFDHHLAADSEYIAPIEYALVADASSTCEHIGYLALKLCLRPEMAVQMDTDNLFTRNFVLAVLTGIVGDSKMGKYLKNRKEQWYYTLFSSTFARLLTETTEKGSSNLSTIDEVFDEITRLSKLEEQCFSCFMEHKQKTDLVNFTLLPVEKTHPLPEGVDMDLLINTARAVTDELAEENGTLGLVAYFDPPEKSDLIQFRLRRSHNYRKLDLRRILEAAGIENGGGHEGAVGFRISRREVPDLTEYVNQLIGLISGLLA